MRSIERGLSLLVGMLLSLYLAAPAWAFTPSDSPLLSAAAVAPNVMLLIDDSGSMNSIIYAAEFNPNVNRTPARQCNAFLGLCSALNAPQITGDTVFLSSLPTSGCSGGAYAFYNNSVAPLCLKLPDPVGNENTRYSADYISYIVSLANSNGTRDFTNGAIPNDYRMNVARNVSTALVSSNRTLRMGLSTFNPATSSNPGNGGFIARSITDLSPVTGSVTQAQADTNYNALISSINGLNAVANTPLAESYYEVTRYMRGLAPYYNGTPATYTSPIQYRCQKNYGVVITDGLPTYDRTFPTNDPLGAVGCRTGMA